VILGTEQAFAGHAFKHLPERTEAYFGLAQVVRNVSAVTGACLMIRRQVFDEVQGFDEAFRIAYGDVDLCLRIRQAGYLIVYTPLAMLVHHESATRRALHPPEDERLARERWRGVIVRGDPYYNPNLSRTRENFSLDV
jgi:GT2 family glycosyltransferase